MSAAKLKFHAVDRAHWGDLEALFSARGAPNWCWCMVWRKGAHGGGPARKTALKAHVDRGEPVGILAYRDGEPIAWCSIGPRESLRQMGGRDRPQTDEAHVWSVVCFFAKRDERGADISGQLLKAAIAEARKHGARIIEAYPVDRETKIYRFMGQVRLFERAGFEEVGTWGAHRHVMRKAIRR